MSGCGLGRVAEQLEHIRHIFDEFGTRLDRFRVFLGVIFLALHGEAALSGVDHYRVRIFQVGTGTKAENGGQRCIMHFGDE